MKAIVKTKSNYKNANNKALTIVEFLGSIVSCEVPEYGFNENGEAQGKMITGDFKLSEVISIKN